MGRVDPFQELRKAIARKNRADELATNHPWYSRLSVRQTKGLLDVKYRGEYELWFQDESNIAILDDLLTLLATAELAPKLRSFTYTTDAALAANGTYNFNIDPLLTSKQNYPNLKTVSLDQGDGEHGYKILNSEEFGDYHSAGDALARLLRKALVLDELRTPSPPDENFFLGPPTQLRKLDIDSGFGHESFVKQLATSTRFPSLKSLVFTEYRQDYMKDWKSLTTPFVDYLSLFRSPLMTQMKEVTLRAVILKPSEIQQLLAIRSSGVSIETRKDR
jgi:hypothetical protein